MANQVKSNQCKFCGKNFFLKSCLVTHELTHKNEVKEDKECGLLKEITKENVFDKVPDKEICDSEEKNVFDCELSKGTDNHTVNVKDGKKFKCEECGKQFNLKSSFKTHMISHKSVEANVCVLCNKTFTAPHYFRAHMIKHAHKECLKCSDCNLEFLSKKIYKQHVNSVHTSPSHQSNIKRIKKEPNDKTISNGDHSENEGAPSDDIVHGFTCSVCHEAFPERGMLDEHFQKHKENLQCHLCLKKYSSLMCLKRHMVSHGWGGNTLCEKCGKVVRSRTYKQHLLLHSGERPYNCPDCCETFNQKAHLNRHRKYHYREDLKLYRCEHCSVSFYRAYRLRQHMELHSDSYYSYHCCYVCDQSYPSKSSLRQHFKSHLGKNPFQCWYCSESFSKSMALFRHERKHYPAQFPCNLCSEVFNSSSRLCAHYTDHALEDIKQLDPNLSLMVYERKLSCTNCHICGKNVRSTFLKFHMRNHTSEKIYGCTECNKTFRSQQSLTIHMRYHTGERPFKCHICNKTFAQRGHLNIHVALHSSTKPYLCKFCGKAFATQGYVSNHEKKYCRGGMNENEHENMNPQDRKKRRRRKRNFSQGHDSNIVSIKQEEGWYPEEGSDFFYDGINEIVVPSIECVPVIKEAGDFDDSFDDPLVLKIEGDMFNVTEVYEQ